MDGATATAHLGAMMGGVALMAAQEGADFDALVAERRARSTAAAERHALVRERVRQRRREVGDAASATSR